MMCPDDSPISGLDGFAGEVYRDIKEVGKWFVNGAAKPFKHYHDTRKALAAFHPYFPKHGVEVTALVDYAKWHE
jgi:hypothetical protein